MILATYDKQPAEIKDYTVDYSAWLAPIEDTLSDVVASVLCLTDTGDSALVLDSVTFSGAAAKIWLSGGTDRRQYKVTLTATTAGGRVDESELIFNIRDY